MPVEVTRSDDLDETKDSDGKIIARIDYKKMTKETALALKQYDINNVLSQKDFIQTNNTQNQQEPNNINFDAEKSKPRMKCHVECL